MQWAPTLYRALDTGRTIFDKRTGTVSEARQQAEQVVTTASQQVAEATEGRVKLELDYVSINSIDTLQDLGDGEAKETAAVISGAMAVIEGGRRTRLIDNLLLGSATALLQ